jgi:arylsulfatase A-like enzyme
MPTVATLAEVRSRKRHRFMGVDLMPVIQDAIDHPQHPTRTVQDSICFTTDETLGERIVGQPSHIRCLREARWKIVEYFDPDGVERSQFELYDLLNDPLELHNMGNRHNHRYFDPRKLAEMLAKLHRRFDQIDSSPIVHDSGVPPGAPDPGQL